jgi:hypothetical protein
LPPIQTKTSEYVTVFSNKPAAPKEDNNEALIRPAKIPDATKEETVPKYIIEREIPGAGYICGPDMQAISQKSATVLQGLGPQIQWVQSYVTEDKIYCVYIAPNRELVLEHARKAGFPANSVAEVKRMIDPTTAE